MCEGASYREAKAACEAFRATEVEHGMEQLLSGMCDAVVHLASDLTIVGPCRNLRSLLLIPTHFESMSRKLHDYMNGDDGERFSGHLHSGALSHDSFLQLPSHPLHVSLRDEATNNVPVELFCVSIADLNGSWRHVVGIKDNSERPLGEVVPPSAEQGPSDTRPITIPTSNDAGLREFVKLPSS